MEFTWQASKTERTAKQVLSAHGVSHRMFSQINRENGQVLVNDQVVKPASPVDTGDRVTLVVPEELADANVPASTNPITIVFENEHLLVVDKPAGLTVVPGPSNRTDTLVNRVKGYLISQSATNLVPHVVTRLDRDTSGLVLIAKHRLANSWLNQQLADHTLVKRYLAVVNGNLTTDHAVIDTPLRRADEGFQQIVAPDGKTAKTEYWVKQRGDDWTLVSVLLHTGRTHQIRAHFKSLGHPLLGDELYDGPMNQINRQALHASELSFNDPVSGEFETFKSELPADMMAIISGH